jgi:hypothetical protein
MQALRALSSQNLRADGLALTPRPFRLVSGGPLGTAQTGGADLVIHPDPSLLDRSYLRSGDEDRLRFSQSHCQH